MHVLIVNNSVIPALKYGGTERVIWWLGKELVKIGHKVTYLVKEGSSCDFAEILHYRAELPIQDQIPASVDVIHLHCDVLGKPDKPYVRTLHGNLNHQNALDQNTVFVSLNHAQRFGSVSFVHNGIDPEDYGDPALTSKRDYFHFLGNASWRVKNVRGAINIAKNTGEILHVVGGYRFNFNMGIRFTFHPRIKFDGMIGGEKKNSILRHSKGLIFPVLWDEPFGLALVESLYFGCPVFGTPYGSLPEIVQSTVGYLSASEKDLEQAVMHPEQFSKSVCHEYVMDQFTSQNMTQAYLKKYEMALNGHALNATAPKLLKLPEQKFLPYFISK